MSEEGTRKFNPGDGIFLPHKDPSRSLPPSQPTSRTYEPALGLSADDLRAVDQAYRNVIYSVDDDKLDLVTSCTSVVLNHLVTDIQTAAAEEHAQTVHCFGYAFIVDGPLKIVVWKGKKEQLMMDCADLLYWEKKIRAERMPYVASTAPGQRSYGEFEDVVMNAAELMHHYRAPNIAVLTRSMAQHFRGRLESS